MNRDELLRQILEQTTEHGVLLLDRAGTIMWCNETVARISGYSREDLLGSRFHRLFTPDDVQDGVPDYELQVSSRSFDIQNDRWLMRADGSKFWASGSTTALKDDQGELVGFGKILRNSTDTKEQLEALRNRADALSKADEQKSIFLATLSHELRNPLAPLSNAIQLMHMTAPQNQALQYPMKLIERQVEFIRRLVDDLLDVSRISAGKIDLQLTRVDVREVLKSAIETARPLVNQRRHRFSEYMLGAPITVEADASRLEQVFVNLLNNAAKYTPEGGMIEVRASMEQSEAIVHVRDNGVGISKDMQPHIFGLFTQVSAKSQHTGGGLGIGLSLVKNLVELHGGTVQVRSDGAGAGSEFTVRLPLAEARE